MKRSRSVKLLTMASTSLVLSSCAEKIDTEGEVYRTAAECQQSEFVPDGDCAPLLDAGEKIHFATAPRYNTMALCVSQHGNGECFTGTGGSQNFFSPSPIGFLVTGALAGSVAADLVRPVYREKDSRRFYTTGGGYLRYMDSGRYGTTRSNIRLYNPAAKQSVPRVQTRTTVASRGGFGSRSRSFGG